MHKLVTHFECSREDCMLVFASNETLNLHKQLHIGPGLCFVCLCRSMHGTRLSWKPSCH